MTLQRSDNAVLGMDMEGLQVAYMHAIAHAAGCQVSELRPDTSKIDLAIFHTAASHLDDSTQEIRLQLKSSYALKIDAIQRPGQTHFSYTLDNATLTRLSERSTIKRALVVMVLPEDPDLWTTAGPKHLQLAHLCYFVNLTGHAITGVDDTNVRIPLENRLDAQALSDMMVRVGQRGEI